MKPGQNLTDLQTILRNIDYMLNEIPYLRRKNIPTEVIDEFENILRDFGAEVQAEMGTCSTNDSLLSGHIIKFDQFVKKIESRKESLPFGEGFLILILESGANMVNACTSIRNRSASTDCI